MTPTRTYLGSNNTIASREKVYETADAIEAQTSNQYEINQKRVLFDDVQLVTLHRERGTAYLIIIGCTALLFLLPGLGFAITGVYPAAITFLVLASPFIAMFIVRALLGVDVVTIFGRRSKAAIRFPIRKTRARDVYTHLMRVIRESQERLAARYAEENLPEAPEPEQPPLPERPVLTWPVR
jgi:hypothetical protein